MNSEVITSNALLVLFMFLLGSIAGWLARYVWELRGRRKAVPSNIVYVPMARGMSPDQPEARALREQTKR